MARRQQQITVSEFYCTKCGNRGFDIPRKVGSEREAGHLKRVYCLHCKEEVNMAEIRGFGDYNKEDFSIEYKYGNFTNEGLRKLPYRQFKHQLRLEGVIA